MRSLSSMAATIYLTFKCHFQVFSLLLLPIMGARRVRKTSTSSFHICHRLTMRYCYLSRLSTLFSLYQWQPGILEGALEQNHRAPFCVFWCDIFQSRYFGAWPLAPLAMLVANRGVARNLLGGGGKKVVWGTVRQRGPGGSEGEAPRSRRHMLNKSHSTEENTHTNSTQQKWHTLKKFLATTGERGIPPLATPLVANKIAS